MRPVAVLFLLFSLTLPAAAGGETLLAQAEGGAVIDEAQRDLIRDFYRDQAAAAAKQAEEKKAEEAKKKSKKSASKTDKKKSPEKPKKPKKPKETKAKDKAKGKTKGKDKTKGKETPPAQQAQLRLEPGSVLPPSLPRRALPRGLDSKLPKLLSGQQRVVVGDDIVLFEKKTGRVLDVVPDVLKGGR